MGLPILIELWNTVLFKLIFAEIFVPWRLHKMSLICNPYICIYELHIFILFIFTANVKGFLKHLNILSKIYKHLFSHLCHQINDKFTPLLCEKNMRKKIRLKKSGSNSFINSAFFCKATYTLFFARWNGDRNAEYRAAFRLLFQRVGIKTPNVDRLFFKQTRKTVRSPQFYVFFLQIRNAVFAVHVRHYGERFRAGKHA